jgi:hypothetical protein
MFGYLNGVFAVYAVVRRPENPHCPVVIEAYHAQKQDQVDI